MKFILMYNQKKTTFAFGLLLIDLQKKSSVFFVNLCDLKHEKDELKNYIFIKLSKFIPIFGKFIHKFCC